MFEVGSSGGAKKAKKALKRLNNVESLLSNVMQGFLRHGGQITNNSTPALRHHSKTNRRESADYFDHDKEFRRHIMQTIQG